MSDAAVAALAMTGATTVVAAMATDAWQTARTRTVQLFHRGDREQHADVEAQLDSSAALVARAGDAARARESLVPLWRIRLEELLGDRPEAAGALDELIRQVGALLPTAPTTQVQNNTAQYGGILYAVVDGNLNVTHQAGTADGTGAEGAR